LGYFKLQRKGITNYKKEKELQIYGRRKNQLSQTDSNPASFLFIDHFLG